MKVLSKTLSKVIPKVMPKVLAKGSGSGDAGVAQCPNLFEPAARTDVNEHTPVNGCTINNPTTTSLQFTAAGADRLDLATSFCTELGRHQLSCDAWTDDGIKDFRLGVYLSSGPATGHHAIAVVATSIAQKVVWEFEVTQDWLDSTGQSYRLRNDAVGTAGQLHVTNFSLSCIVKNANHRHIYIDASAAGGGDGSEILPYNSFSSINWSTGGDNSIADWVAAKNDVFINLKRDTVMLNEALNPTINGAPFHPITIQPYGVGEDPIIDRNSVTSAAMNLTDRSYFVIDSIHFRNTGHSIIFHHGNNITIKNCTFRDFIYSALFAHGENNYDIYNLIIDNNDIGNSDNKAIQLKITGSANTIGPSEPGPGTGTGYNISITNNNIYFVTAGIYLQSDIIVYTEGIGWNNIDIDNNTVQECPGYGILINGMLLDLPERSYVRRNNLYKIGDDSTPDINGIQLGFCHNLIVENNIVDTVVTNAPDECGIIIDWVGNWAPIIDAHSSTDVIVRSNIVKNNTYGNAGKGINVWAAINTEVYNNIIINCTTGIIVGQDHCIGTKVYHNTILDCNDGMRLNTTAPEVDIKYNIVVDSLQYGINRVTGAIAPDEDYNCVYNSTIEDYYNFIEGANSIDTDPLLVDQLGEDYRIQSGSPCRDAGPGVGILIDFDRNMRPLGLNFDMGAYEHV